MFGFQSKRNVKTAWHPDFRIVEELPDIKVVRTKFLINIISIVIFGILLIIVGYREIIKIGLKQNIRSYQSEIEDRQPANRKLTAMSIDFTKLGEELKDVKQFKKQPLDLIETIIELSEMRGSGVVYDRVSYRHEWDASAKKEVYNIRLHGKGRTTADIGELKTHLSALNVAPNYQIKISEVGNPTKDPTTGVFSFVILVTISEDKNASK